MQRSPSVPTCSESSWHWPAALQFALSPENDVLPFASRRVWQLAHGTSLCRLISGNEPFAPWTSPTILLSLPVRIVGSPGCMWHCRHCAFLYLPWGCSSSLWTLACAWHDMHSLFGSKV